MIHSYGLYGERRFKLFNLNGDEIQEKGFYLISDIVIMSGDIALCHRPMKFPSVWTNGNYEISEISEIPLSSVTDPKRRNFENFFHHFIAKYVQYD